MLWSLRRHITLCVFHVYYLFFSRFDDSTRTIDALTLDDRKKILKYLDEVNEKYDQICKSKEIQLKEKHKILMEKMAKFV